MTPLNPLDDFSSETTQASIKSEERNRKQETDSEEAERDQEIKQEEAEKDS